MFKNLFKWGKKDKQNKSNLKEQEDRLEESNNYSSEPLIDKKLESNIEIEEDENKEIETETKNEEVLEKPKVNFFDKLKVGLDKARKNMTDKIDDLLKSYSKIDDELFDDLEEILVTADVGINTTMEIIDKLKDRVKEEKVSEPKDVKNLLK